MRPIILCCTLMAALSSLTASAQTSNAGIPEVRFGQIQGAMPSAAHLRGKDAVVNATLEQVVAFPRLVVMNPTCVVKDFTLSVLSKGQKVAGPFTTQEGKLTDEEMAVVKKYANENEQLVMQNIHISGGGGEQVGNNVTVNITAAK